MADNDLEVKVEQCSVVSCSFCSGTGKEGSIFKTSCRVCKGKGKVKVG